MKVELVRVNDSFHFEATGASGVVVHTDGAPDIGGHNLGARPMELLLMGLASCSAIDIVLILKKQRQEVKDFRMSVNGERTQEADSQRSPFRSINVQFFLTGQLDAAKVARAVALSMTKYCSATAQFEPLCQITHEVFINQ